MAIDTQNKDFPSREYRRPRKGLTIGVLPLPDGRRARYEAQGKHALRAILALWKAECSLIEFVMTH